MLRQCQQDTGVTLTCVRHYLYGTEQRFTWAQAASAANQGPFVEQQIHKLDCWSQEYKDVVRGGGDDGDDADEDDDGGEDGAAAASSHAEG